MPSELPVAKRVESGDTVARRIGAPEARERTRDVVRTGGFGESATSSGSGKYLTLFDW